MSSPHKLVTDPARLRRQLVEEMSTKGALTSVRLAQAFETVPRETFVPSFYERERGETKMVWKSLSATMMSQPGYLAQVYRDEPLVTKVDERGWPTSSSSMPSAMARMLEALDVHPGHRILEIGTGTGYNAAVLATLVGDPHLVTTMEVDAELASHASACLRRVVGEGCRVLVADGFAGDKRYAPYDRMLATASASMIPPAWIEQLAPGGKLVMDLQGSLESGFLVVEKRISGNEAIGHFLNPPLYFMPLLTGAITELPPVGKQAHLLKQPVHSIFDLSSNDPFPHMLKDRLFRWFLQWCIKGCRIVERKEAKRASGGHLQTISLVDHFHQSMLLFVQFEHGWQGKVYGSRDLMTALRLIYEEWVQAGSPSQSAYAVAFDDQNHATLILGSLQLVL